jgi:large subunit ribosomal protein L4
MSSKKVNVYNETGSVVKELDLNPKIFDVKVNPIVIQQVILGMAANARLTLAHTKTKDEVRGGGRKPWKQKGTGRARHGSTRSPIWIGGGVTFGPRNDRDYTQKINKKMKRQALFMSLSDRANNETIKVIDSLNVTDFKTKKMVQVLAALSLPKSTLIVSSAVDEKLVKSVSNLPKIEVIDARNLNVAAVIKYKNLLITEDAFADIEKTFLKTV